MHLDVQDLRDFYYRSSLGAAVQRSLREQMRDFWPHADRQTLVGYGFAVPLLRPYARKARRVIAVMPAQQGVTHWPPDGENVALLSDETLWPIATDSVDRLVMLHGLETSDRPGAVLEEAARVLAPEGRVLLILPNRRGIWARRDGTPFGFGRPYSLGQVERQLVAHGFQPERHAAAMFFPPSGKRFWLRTARIWERIGRALSSYNAGGVLLVEAVRRDPPPPAGLRVGFRRPVRVLDAATAGAARPA